MTTERRRRIRWRRGPQCRGRGFTLVELLLVMAILAIISSLGLAVIAGAEKDALVSRTRAQLDRLSSVMNQNLEEFVYRVLPVRIKVAPPVDPEAARAFREAMLNEFLRVEFPWKQADVDPATFPQNMTLAMAPNFINAAEHLPQISRRFLALLNSQTAGTWLAKVPQDLNMNAMIDPEELEVFQRTVSAECLYVILSLNTDQDGERLVGLLRSGEIGDTDGDGALEVLDAFGDPVRFALVGKPDSAELAALPAADFEPSLRPDFSVENGFEIVLSSAVLVAGQPIGQVRGPRPINEFGFLIQSVNTGEPPATGQTIPSY